MLKEILRLFFQYSHKVYPKNKDRPHKVHDIRISVSVPFIFRITLTKHPYWQGGISVRFLIFHFGIHKYGGLGWNFWPNIEKWDINWRIHMKKILISFSIGLSKMLFMGWKMRRLERKIRLKEDWKNQEFWID